MIFYSKSLKITFLYICNKTHFSRTNASKLREIIDPYLVYIAVFTLR